MQDNGLLKYYKDKHASKPGYLTLSDYPFKISLEIEEDYGCVRTMYERNKKYYFKLVNRGEVDAELLLSQIYARAGFKTAIYTPLNPTGVISQSVMGDKCQVARQFFLSKAMQEKDSFSAKDQQALSDKLMPQAYRDFKIYSHNFTKDCAREYLKMRIFDVATQNSDRNIGNYIVRQNSQGLGSEILSIDYGASGCINRPNKYFSSLDGQVKNTADEIIELFKTSEEINKFVSPSEMAEQIGSINVEETAKDIKQTIGFELEQFFVNEISYSMDQTAEALIK